MKKVALLLVLCLVVGVFACMFTGCATQQLQKQIDRLKDADSYTMVVSIGLIEMKTKYDGKITWQEEFFFTPEHYDEEVKGGKNVYSKQEDGTWIKTFKPDEANAEDEDIMDKTDEFTAKDFKKKDGVYYLSEEKCKELEFKDFSIEIVDKGKEIVMRASVEQGAETIKTKIRIYDIDDTHLKLPKVSTNAVA